MLAVYHYVFIYSKENDDTVIISLSIIIGGLEQSGTREITSSNAIMSSCDKECLAEGL